MLETIILYLGLVSTGLIVVAVLCCEALDNNSTVRISNTKGWAHTPAPHHTYRVGRKTYRCHARLGSYIVSSQIRRTT